MKHKWVGGGFVTPALLLLLLFFIFPIAFSIHQGFYEVGLTTKTWVGIDNFKEVLFGTAFWNAVRTSFKFLAFVLFTDLVIAYLIALGLTRINKRIAMTLRTFYYVPVVLSSLVTISVWRWFLRYEGGMFNEVLSSLHLPMIEWLGQPAIAPWALCIVLAGGAVGVSVLLYSAALGQLNPELIDAARVDGANELQIIWHIITPLVRPTMLYIIVTNTISSFQIWETPYFFTRGGPLHSTSTVALTIFDTAFGANKFGLASAMTAVAMIITSVFALVFIKKMKFGQI